MTEIRKLVRDGKVGVVISALFDSDGWYTAHHDLQLLFLPELIELIESDEYKNKRLNIDAIVRNLLSPLGYDIDFYPTSNLTVEWISVNTQFKVEQKHIRLDMGAYEEVIVVNDGNWITA